MIFCNIKFNIKSKSDIFRRIHKEKAKFIVTANAAFIVEANTSKRFFDILDNNYVTFDGKIPWLAAKILSGLGLVRCDNELL